MQNLLRKKKKGRYPLGKGFAKTNPNWKDLKIFLDKIF
jgi:hypothetical protein